MTFIVKKKEQVPHSFERFVNGFLQNTLGENQADDQKNYRAIDPKINIIEKEGFYELQFALPGWTKNDITVQVDQEVLIVKGQKDAYPKEGITYHNYEYDFGKFEKRFDLPEEKFGDLTANVKDGVLTISIAKKVKKDTNKKITVS